MRTMREDFHAVRNLCQEIQPKMVIEIGVWTGAMTLVFAEFAECVFCIDHWHGTPGDNTEQYLRENGGPSEVFGAFCRNMGKYLLTKAIPIVGESRHIASVWPEHARADLIYIDAGHGYFDVSKDIDAWWPHLKKGGVMAGHDYNPNFPGVIKAVKDRFGEVKSEGSVWRMAKEVGT